LIHVPLDEVAVPALWLFLLGFLLAVGIVRARRARDDVRDDWNRLVRFNERLKVLEATGGLDEPARSECAALARALDEFLDPPFEKLTLAALVDRFDPQGHPWGVDADVKQASAAALRVRVLQIDRELQARMKATARASGSVGRVFLAGLGGVLVTPLEVARRIGLLRRLTARRVEESPWFHAALGVALFVVAGGTALVAHRLWRLAMRMAEDLGLRS
jgi:hypothetical protein